VIGHTDAEIYEDPAVSRALMANDRRIMQGGETVLFEETVPTPEGVRTFLSTKTPYRDDKGEVIGLICIARDGTERKQIEREREQLLASEHAARLQAEEANRLKDEFLATLSHELRTPLTSIIGWATILRDRWLSPEKIRTGLEAVERNARAQARIVDDLLDVSGIASGKFGFEKSEFEITGLLRMSVDSVRPAADAKKIALAVNVRGSDFWIEGDATRLQQAIANVLSNAVKFTPEGGRISIDLGGSPEWIHLTIADTGVGIAPDFLPFVLDRFRQADGSMTRNFGGLGLALAITRHILKNHGGTIRASSGGSDHGASFTIEIPRRMPAVSRSG
jgi:signal transduction histidine kinase